MKTRVCLFVLLLTSSLSATLLTYGQGEKKPRTFEDYRARTLRELTTLQPDNFGKDRQINTADLRVVVHADLLPSRVKALYDGTTRPLVGNKKYVITEWAKLHAGAPEFYTAPYETEMLFAEDGESYWLAVRKEDLPKFDQDLKKGEALELFLIKMGNAHSGDKLEPVLLVEKFVKQ